MGKGTTVAQVREAARVTQELGMQAGFFILLGYPDETTADIRATIDFLKETRPDVVGTSVAFPIKGTEFYERVANRVIPNENWSSRNQNKLLFKGKYPRLYYWFAARWLVKEVNVDKMWRMPNRPYMKIAVESAKLIVARLGVALVDAASFRLSINHYDDPTSLPAISTTATDSTKLRTAAAADRANPAAVAAATVAIGTLAASSRHPGRNRRRVAAATVAIGTLAANAGEVCLFSGNPLGQRCRTEDCPFRQRRCGSVEPLQHYQQTSGCVSAGGDPGDRELPRRE